MSDDVDHSKKLAAAAFDQATPRGAPSAGIPDDAIEALIAGFESAAQVDDEDNSSGCSRSSGSLRLRQMGHFIAVVEKAKITCEQAGRECDAHFADVGKMVSLRSGAEREIEDIALSRYAAYLTAHNADGRRRPIAFAQTYFAIQTRRQEIADQETRLSAAFRGWRRVLLRDEIKIHNRHLASAAKNAGVQEGLDFAIFQTKGYKGLYGGLDVAGIRRRKGLSKSHAILDHMGSTELAANLPSNPNRRHTAAWRGQGKAHSQSSPL